MVDILPIYLITDTWSGCECTEAHGARVYACAMVSVGFNLKHWFAQPVQLIYNNLACPIPVPVLLQWAWQRARVLYLGIKTVRIEVVTNLFVKKILSFPSAYLKVGAFFPPPSHIYSNFLSSSFLINGATFLRVTTKRDADPGPAELVSNGVNDQ